ncbi:MAG: hypothetical protein K2H11_00840, partial [Malacoplasma sp.]|nr:hypothetical protein [Malacoplasma sp.]
MKILYTCNLETNADNGDKNLYWGSNNAKFLKVKDVLKSTLKNYYDEKNISASLNEFVIDFQKLCNKFQLCYLNSTGQLPRTTIEKITSDELQEKTLKNVVIIGQSDYEKKWKNYNSAAIFCDLKIFNSNEKLRNIRNGNITKSDVLFYFQIKRIEFLDLPYLDESSDYNNFVDLKSVEFQEYKESELKSYYEFYKNSSDLSVIAKLKHTVEIFKNDEDTKEDINELKKWKETIKKLFELVNNESNLVNYLFSFEEYNFSDLTNKDFYLISKQEKLNSENLIYFTFAQDDSISFKVRTKIKSDAKETENFLKITENKIKKNNIEIDKIATNIKTYFDEIDKHLKEKETKEKQLEKKSKEISNVLVMKQGKEQSKRNLNSEISSHNQNLKRVLNKISELESDIK